MSEEERLRQQGQAYADLKRARANVATLRVVLLRYEQTLGSTARSLRSLLEDPRKAALSAYSLKENIRSLSEAERIEASVDELVAETKRVDELEDLVSRF